MATQTHLETLTLSRSSGVTFAECGTPRQHDALHQPAFGYYLHRLPPPWAAKAG